MIDDAAFLTELHGEAPRPGNTAGFAILFDDPAERRRGGRAGRRRRAHRRHARPTTRPGVSGTRRSPTRTATGPTCSRCCPADPLRQGAGRRSGGPARRSSSVTPPAEWLTSVRCSVRQRRSTSGWWSISSATSAIAHDRGDGVPEARQLDGAVDAVAVPGPRAAARAGRRTSSSGERRGGRGMRPILPLRSSAQVWMPHSVLLLPAQRPARGSSPGATGRVHGAQPIEP